MVSENDRDRRDCCLQVLECTSEVKIESSAVEVQCKRQESWENRGDENEVVVSNNQAYSRKFHAGMSTRQEMMWSSWRKSLNYEFLDARAPLSRYGGGFRRDGDECKPKVIDGKHALCQHSGSSIVSSSETLRSCIHEVGQNGRTPRIPRDIRRSSHMRADPSMTACITPSKDLPAYLVVFQQQITVRLSRTTVKDITYLKCTAQQ